MTTPSKLITNPGDSLWVRGKKWLARLLWDDLTALQDKRDDK